VPFFQDPPALGNQLDDDRVLRSYLTRALPPDVLRAVTPSLREMGELSGGPLYRLQLEDIPNEPRLVGWDAWGHRADRIEVTPLWKEAARLAAQHGVVGLAYERAHGAFSRIHQFALAYLFDPSTDVYSCPLAMTDGAAKTLVHHRNAALVDRAVPRLTSRDPAFAWTSGQWMTERTGGSDVGLTETVAREAGDGSGRFRISGTKWFTSATTAQMALTLARTEARPEGAPPGGRGLTLFYVEVWGEGGARNGITVNRLKDKLGTRKVPTAELTLDGTLATPVVGLGEGIRNIAPMLNVTRTWNAVMACAGMRRAIALARDYSRRRVQFGSPIAKKPLHAETLADMQAEYEAAFHLAFRVVELLGREEAGEIGEAEGRLLRLLTPIAKLTTGKQAVAVASEALECFGGAGYVEDTGLPRLLRDAQVLPIWEGTTNVLSLDTLKALAKDRSLADLEAEVRSTVARVKDGTLAALGEVATGAVTHALAWLMETQGRAPQEVEAGARRFALTVGRALELALLVRHADWALAIEGDRRPAFAAARFAAHGVDQIRDTDDGSSAAALAEEPRA
jgi:acyl-CoA dehydrogenase